MKAVLDHVGIAVERLDEALAFYRDALGLDVERPEEVPHAAGAGAHARHRARGARAARSHGRRFADCGLHRRAGPGCTTSRCASRTLRAALAQLPRAACG
jgi:catechol 2,3-dioxygenase-like lactoylglutathione lyase family enzyme